MSYSHVKPTKVLDYLIPLVFKISKGPNDDNIMRNIFCNIFQNSNKVLCYLNMLAFNKRSFF